VSGDDFVLSLMCRDGADPHDGSVASALHIKRRRRDAKSVKS